MSKIQKNATIQESWEYWWQDECCGSKRQATELRGSISQPILLHMLLLPEPNGHVGDSGRLKRRGDGIPVWGSSLLPSLWRVRIPTTTKLLVLNTCSDNLIGRVFPRKDFGDPPPPPTDIKQIGTLLNGWQLKSSIKEFWSKSILGNSPHWYWYWYWHWTLILVAMHFTH